MATFRFGNIGPEVTLIQSALNLVPDLNAGLKTDGIFGPLTRGSTVKFQQRSNLSPDGIVGTNTLNALSLFLPAVLNLLQNVSHIVPPPPIVLPTPADGKPRDITGYFEIDLSDRRLGDKQKRTGIWLPIMFRPGNTIDVVLYFHGIRAPIVNEYWSRQSAPFFHLRDLTFDTGANVALVVPSLGTGDGSEAGLVESNPDDYLDKVMAAIRAMMAQFLMITEQVPTLGNLVFAAHSGGGRPMFYAAQRLANYRQNLRECWGFDCIYGETNHIPPDWATWAKFNQGKKLFIYYTSFGGTDKHSEKLKARAADPINPLPNVIVEHSRTDVHDLVPSFYWPRQFDQARFFQLCNAR